MSKLSSNINVKNNPLFKGLKSMFIEEGLVNSAKSSSASKVLKKNADDFADLEKVNEVLGKKMGSSADPKKTKGIFENVSASKGQNDASKKGFFGGFDKETSEKIAQATEYKSSVDVGGIAPSDPHKVYDKNNKSIRRETAARTPFEMVDKYFVNPFRESNSLLKNGSKKESATKFKTGLARSGAAVGVGALGVGVATHGKDETNSY